MSPKKSDHKHEFSDCIYEYNNPNGMFSKEKGFCSKVEIFGGTYCKICGKIGIASNYRFAPRKLIGFDWWDKSYELSERAKLELNPETRTLPLFYLKDKYIQKYVELEKN